MGHMSLFATFIKVGCSFQVMKRFKLAVCKTFNRYAYHKLPLEFARSGVDRLIPKSRFDLDFFHNSRIYKFPVMPAVSPTQMNGANTVEFKIIVVLRVG